MAGGLSANTKASLIAMNAPFAFPTSVTELFSEPFRSPHGLSVVNIIALACPCPKKLKPRMMNVLSTISRSEEHTSELQSLMRISYAVFCLKKKTEKLTKTQQLARHKHHSYRLHTPTQHTHPT